MTEGPANGPAPSRHIFLHELTRIPAGLKVRFLGCVIDYDVNQAFLYVEHAYPIDLRPRPRVAVDVRLILEMLKSEELRVGAWLNVIGYVRRSTSQQDGGKKASIDTKVPEAVDVQAVMLWNAGAIKLGEYEAILERQREVNNSAKEKAALQI